MPGDVPARAGPIVVVGSCASGKTTLVNALEARSIEARAVAQEHSIVRDLWARRQPSLLVFLEVDLETIRKRRSPGWPEAIYRVQQERLADARNHADVIIDSATVPVEEVLDRVIAAIQEHPSPVREIGNR